MIVCEVRILILIDYKNIKNLLIYLFGVWGYLVFDSLSYLNIFRIYVCKL